MSTMSPSGPSFLFKAQHTFKLLLATPLLPLPGFEDRPPAVEMKAMDDPHHSAAVLPVSSVSSSPATSVMYEDSVESSFELSPDQAVCVREMLEDATHSTLR